MIFNHTQIVEAFKSPSANLKDSWYILSESHLVKITLGHIKNDTKAFWTVGVVGCPTHPTNKDELCFQSVHDDEIKCLMALNMPLE